MRPNLLFILNPRAGRCQLESFVAQARRLLWGYELFFTAPLDKRELVRALGGVSSRSYAAIVPVGGDGTINCLLQCLFEEGVDPSRVPIYPFPGGTANDLATHLGLRRDWTQLQCLLDSNSHEPIDVISVNEKYFATVGGIGIGSALTRRINTKRSTSLAYQALSKLAKQRIYGLSALRTILKDEGFVHRVQLRSDDLGKTLEAASLLVCNQPFLGHDLHIAPDACNADGMFEYMAILGIGRVELIKALHALKKGERPPAIVFKKSKHLVVESVDGALLEVFGDGESLLQSPRLEFKIIPKAIRMYHARRTRSPS